MTKQEQEDLKKEIHNVFKNRNNLEIKMFIAIENFINKRYEAINYTRCSLTLEDLKVNRFEVIDKVGRAYVNYCDRPLNIETSLQDDDRTLKIFLDD